MPTAHAVLCAATTRKDDSVLRTFKATPDARCHMSHPALMPKVFSSRCCSASPRRFKNSSHWFETLSNFAAVDDKA